MAITQLTGKQIKDQSIDLTTDVTGVLPTVNGGTPQYILLQDQKPSGTNGGAYGSLANVWKQRNLNTIVNDDTGSVVVSSNNFTLPAGTYEINVHAPGSINKDSFGRLRLYNRTSSAVALYGVTRAAPGDGIDTTFRLDGKITIATSTSFSIDIYMGNSSTSTTSLGACGAGIAGVPEVYTQVELRKVA